MNGNIFLSSFCGTQKSIQKKRDKILTTFLFRFGNPSSHRIQPLRSTDLKYLFYCYDRHFFSRFFTLQYPGQLKFSLSQRMTRSAGKLIYPRSFKNMDLQDVTLEIRMATEVFLNYYQLSTDKIVNGIKTDTVFQAFLLVFEHEICHLLELLFWKKTSCRRENFKELAYQLFGHTDVYHQLPLGKEIAREKYGLEIGDRVSFTHQQQRCYGYIKRITKRATVIVPDPQGNHVQEGIPCFIWYVPVEDLTRV